MTARTRSGLIVAAGLALGVGTGIVLTHRHATRYEFLKGTTAVAVRDASVTTSSGVILGTTTYFSFEGDWTEVVARAKREMPNALERDTVVGGYPAKVLTVPREENGRLRLFFPPEKEITILPQRLVLTEGGQIMSQPDERRWASVKVSEYREPHLLDSAVDWVRDHLNI